MKRLSQATLLGVLVLFFYSSQIFASTGIDLHVNGHKVKAEPYTYMGGFTINGEESRGKYYLDVLPQIKEDRTYIPISTVTNILGADVSWVSPCVTINYHDTKIVLTIGQKEVIENGKRMILDVEPYLERGRIMVPLRFISETLGIGVNYQKDRHKIDLIFPEVKTDHVSISSIQKEYWMTMGSAISESKSNICISRIYEMFTKSKTKEVDEPEFFGIHFNLDEPQSYTLLNGYYFTDHMKNAVEKYEVYYELSSGMVTGNYALRDVLSSKWYQFTQEQYDEIIDLEHLGDWEEIMNNIV